MFESISNEKNEIWPRDGHEYPIIPCRIYDIQTNEEEFTRRRKRQQFEDMKSKAKKKYIKTHQVDMNIQPQTLESTLQMKWRPTTAETSVWKSEVLVIFDAEDCFNQNHTFTTVAAQKIRAAFDTIDNVVPS